MTNEAQLIDKFCSIITKPFFIYSTNNSILIYFETHTGRPNHLVEGGEKDPSEMRGFRASYEVGTKFVDLSRIHFGEHIIGTECDRKIKSDGKTNGTITSPYYPDFFPLNVVCRYFFDGLNDRMDLEKVVIQLDDFQLGEDENEELMETVEKNENGKKEEKKNELVLKKKDQKKEEKRKKKCRKGSLTGFTLKKTLKKVFEKLKNEEEEEEEEEIIYDDEVIEPDLEMCGNNWSGEFVLSDNSQMFLEFNSHSASRKSGFRAQYFFVTDLAIPGTPVSKDVPCHFLYTSELSNFGYFNSPRHPGYYPDNSYCIYDLEGKDGEVVRITFENFQLQFDQNCTKDYVDVLKIVSGKEPSDAKQVHLMGHYCGEKLPGPLDEGVKEMKVVLHSNEKENHKGFRAKYEFVQLQSKEKRCIFNETGGGAGVIKSPNYPHKYTTNITCSWEVTGSSKNSRFLLNFDIFNIEGNPNKRIGCGNAVLKIYLRKDELPVREICGEGSKNNLTSIYTSLHFFIIKFISTAKAIGGKGFLISWTELLAKKGAPCPGFKCKKSGHCISNLLRCNGRGDCGGGDISDEDHCKIYREGGAMNIIICIVAIIFILLLLGVTMLWLMKRRRRRKRKKMTVEVKYTTKSLLNNKNSYLKERVERVSLV